MFHKQHDEQSVCSGKQTLWQTSKEMESYVKSKYYLILDTFDETELYWQWSIKKFGENIDQNYSNVFIRIKLKSPKFTDYIRDRFS